MGCQEMTGAVRNSGACHERRQRPDHREVREPVNRRQKPVRRCKGLSGDVKGLSGDIRGL